MNKLERYSLHSGLKISKPFIDNSFFPITHDKYITFNTSTKIQSKHYDLWQEVIDLLTPFLNLENIKLIQIGDKKDPTLEGVHDFRGSMNFNQNAYVLKKSMLHFNVCDHYSYVSYNSNTPSVVLFSNEPSDSFCSFDKSGLNKNFTSIDSPKEFGCSYSPIESPKSINKISPSLIANKILNNLEIINNLDDLNPIYIGENYHVRVLEFIPDYVPPQDLLKNSIINVRADYYFDQENIFHLSRGRKLGVITNQKFSEELCYACKDSLARVSIEVDDLDFDFLKILKKFKIPYELFTYNKENINKLRLDNIDEKILLYNKKTKKDLDLPLDSDHNKIFKSSKILISNGQKFASKAHWMEGKELNAGEDNFIIDSSDFWEGLDYYIIYNKEEENVKRKTKRKQE